MLKTTAVIVLTGFTLSYGRTPADLSLAGAVKRGLENNYSIRIARQDLKIAENNNTWSTAGRYPTLDLGVNFNNTYSNDPSQADPGSREKSMLGIITPYVNLRWTLFNGFAIKITKDRLAYLNDLSEGYAAIAVENTIQGIVLAYYKALLEQEKLKVTQEVLKLSKDRYDYVVDRKNIGAASTYDVLQTKIAWLNDTSDVLLQKVNVRNALRNLNLVLGEPAGKQFNLTDTFAVQTHEYKLEELLDKLFKSNKTLRNQYINQAILKKDISLQRSSLYPSIALNSGVNRIGTRLKFENIPAVTSNSYDYYVNFSVSLNLFNGGNTRRAIANAKIRHKIGDLQIEEIKLSLSNFMRTTFELYNVKKQLYTVAEERIKSARLNLDISGEKFKAGAINSFNYRDVQLIYLNAAFGKLQAIYDLIDTHSELMRLTGSVISEY
jgi:outer membrane protein TolC